MSISFLSDTFEMMMIKKWLNQKNGWQRIYLVILVFIYLPFVVLLATDNSPKVITESEFIKIAPDSVLTAIQSKVVKFPYEVESDSLKIDFEKAPKETFYSDESHRWHKHRFSISNEISPSEHDGLRDAIHETIKKEYRLRKIKEALVDWIFPASLIACFVYFFGFAIGWAFRGFKK